MAATTVIGLAQTVVLSRLLEPRDFGLLGMIWTVLGLVQMFSDMGLSNAIIQKQDLPTPVLSSIYWATFMAGIAAALITLISVPIVAYFYNEPALQALMPWLALVFVFTAVGQPFQMILQRSLAFNQLATIEVSSALITFVVAVAAAYSKLGAFSLVLASLTAAFAKASLTAFRAWPIWKPELHFKTIDLSHVMRFGLFQLGDKAANYVAFNVDYLMVGRYLGAEQLGYYRLAFETVVRPLSTVNPIINSVAFPVFAQRQNEPAVLREGYTEVIRIISTLVFPMLAGLAVVAPQLVTFVYTAKWAPAVPLIQILAILGCLRALGNPVGSLLLALGRVDVGFYINGSLAVANIIGFYFMAQQSVVAVSWYWVIVLSASILISWKACYWNTIQLPPKQYVKAASPAILFSLIMVAAVHGATTFTSNLAVLITFGALVYTALMFAFQRAYVRQLFEMLGLKRAQQV